MPENSVPHPVAARDAADVARMPVFRMPDPPRALVVLTGLICALTFGLLLVAVVIAS